MLEILFNFDEFRNKLDSSKPVRHCFYMKGLDKHGIFYRIEFWITGVSKDASRIIAFYFERRSTLGEKDEDQKWMEEMVEKLPNQLGQQKASGKNEG